MKAPSHFMWVRLVVQAWSKVFKEVVNKSFDVCSIPRMIMPSLSATLRLRVIVQKMRKKYL